MNFRWERWTVVVIVVIVLLVVIVPSWMKIRDSGRETKCAANLKQIGAALHQYHETYRSFPPAFTVNGRGDRLHSWRVLILPFLDEETLYGQLKLDEPWNSPHNQRFLDRMPRVYSCPASLAKQPTSSSYLAVVGKETAWPEQYAASMEDIHDEPFATVLVVEAADSLIPWMEPRDISFEEAKSNFDDAVAADTNGPRIRITSRHSTNSGDNLFHILLADGSVNRASSTLWAAYWERLLTSYAGQPFPGADWPESKRPARRSFATARPDSAFRQTDIWPVTNTAILPGRNLAYCPTLQHAWDTLRNKSGEPAVKLNGSPRLADELNRARFEPTSLSPTDFISRAEESSSQFVEDVRGEMSRKGMESIPTPLLDAAPSTGLVIYCVLSKNLPFPHNFERLEVPLAFHDPSGDVHVKSFGIVEYGQHTESPRLWWKQQVVITDYVSDNDFVLQLISKSEKDEIFLAKCTPATTLSETISAVEARIQTPHPKHKLRQLRAGEPLRIPNLGLSVTRSYRELAGRAILNPGMAGLPLDSVEQTILFCLDEAGVRLVSEATMVLDGDEPPPDKRQFVFDKPFLVLLREKNSAQPYFALWVANAEILEAAGN